MVLAVHEVLEEAYALVEHEMITTSGSFPRRRESSCPHVLDQACAGMTFRDCIHAPMEKVQNVQYAKVYTFLLL